MVHKQVAMHKVIDAAGTKSMDMREVKLSKHSWHLLELVVYSFLLLLLLPLEFLCSSKSKFKQEKLVKSEWCKT